MTYQEKIIYLSRYSKAKQKIRLLDKQIEEMNDRIMALRSARISPRVKLTGMPGARNAKDLMAEYAAKLDKLQRECEKYKRKKIRQIEKQQEIKAEIERELEKMPTQRYQNILWARFIYGMTWAQTAKFANYSEPQSKRLYKAAIAEFDVRTKDDTK